MVSIDNDRHTLSLGEERPLAPAALNAPSPVSTSRPGQAGTAFLAVPRGRIGVSMQDLTRELVESSDVLEGAAIARVEPGGPADRAGIHVGDIVTAVNGVSVRTGTDLRDRILRAEVGRNAYLTIVRQRSFLQIPV